MTLHTKIQPNGIPGKYEVVWSTTMKVIATAVGGLLVIGVVGLLSLNTKVAVMQTKLDSIQVSVSGHVAADEEHEDGEAKANRIRRIVREELQHHLNAFHRE